MKSLREDAFRIIEDSIISVLPEKAVEQELEKLDLGDKIYLVAIGKAAWRMAKSARDFLNGRIKGGVVITKYGHSQGPIDGLEVCEAGHPIPDENTIKATKKAIEFVQNLSKDDVVLFLVSGGGSSLFELPVDGVSLEDIKNVTDMLLRCGANIVEINAIRKRLSQVKGGKFAQLVLSAARGIRNYPGVVIVSVGTDGTDGPTDSAGGIVDGQTAIMLEEAGIDIDDALDDNDSYHALQAVGSLIKTGPTGTNVNDLIFMLCGRDV